MFTWGLIFTTGIILIVLVVWLNARNNHKTLNALKEQWGQISGRHRDFGLISLYFESIIDKDTKTNLCDRTWSDLDMDDVFCLVDRTNSKIGQQVLYNIIRDQGKSINDLRSFDRIVEFYSNNPDKRAKVQQTLSKLDSVSLYFYHSLFMGSIPNRPGYYLIYPILSILSAASIVGLIFEPLFIWPFMAMICLCISLHYYNKTQIGSYIDGFNNIRKVVKAVMKIQQNYNNSDKKNDLSSSIRNCQSISKRTSWISDYPGDGNEIMALLYTVTELIKGAFLIESILFYSALSKINKNKPSLWKLFEFVGNHDAAISVASFRTSLPYFSKPLFTDSKKGLQVKNLVHPLIDKCIPNSISTLKKSVLITGSNMAGKSTFIKSIGVNTILSQSIYTSLSEKYETPRMRVFTCINISDNIKENRSYFMEEINAVGELIKESKEENCLFILDELFRGTNTFDRIAASKAVLSFLPNSSNIVFISTHDVELSDLLDDRYALYHFQDEIINNKLIFNYKLREGIPTKSNAIQLLEICKFPEEIIKEAKLFKKNNQNVQ